MEAVTDSRDEVGGNEKEEAIEDPLGWPSVLSSNN